jgi:hypothetical protein
LRSPCRPPALRLSDRLASEDACPLWWSALAVFFDCAAVFDCAVFDGAGFNAADVCFDGAGECL